jgi:hypothetical protein
MRLDFRCDNLVRHHVDTLRNLPSVKQRREAARITIGIGRLVESVVNEIKSELLLAVLTISDVVFSCHALPMPRRPELSHVGPKDVNRGAELERPSSVGWSA